MKIGLMQGMRRAVLMRPHGVAVLDGDAQFTWSQFADRVARLAAVFKTLGLEAGDRVALLALNSHRSLECYFAALHAGGVITPLNHRLSAQEIAVQISDAEPKVILLGPEFSHLASVLQQAAGTSCAFIHCADEAAPDGMMGYETALAGALPGPEVMRGGDDLACLFYTGGTTGAPKGVMLSHANILANSANFISHIGMDERTIHLHCGPLFHVAAGVRLFSVTQAAGTHVVLPRFVADEVLSVIARHRVTLATFVPTMLRALLDEPAITGADLSSLRYITYGAAAMPEALLRQVMARLPDVRFVQSYGMTETSPIATMLGWREHIPDMVGKGLLRSAGRPALLADIAVVDPSGDPVPAGERGEIVVRGPMVMLGYWRQPAATSEALRDGWMHTGDIGYLDDDGYLFVVDRLKDVIISGGENIYSQEVENAIAAHPSVQQCAVFGRPHARWGEAVHAVVVPAPGLSIEPQQVIDHCKSMIAGFKCPRSVEVRLTALPLSGANKILKNQLRADLLAREPQA